MSKKPKKASTSQCFSEGRYLAIARERIRCGLSLVEDGKRLSAADALITAADVLGVHTGSPSTADKVRALAYALRRKPQADAKARILQLVNQLDDLLLKRQRACGDRRK